MRFHHKIAVVLLLQFALAFFASAQPVPTGRPISIPEILDVARSFGGFLYIFGGILAVITIMISGVMYLLAGANPQRVKTAKDILVAGIIGAFIIFSVGTIVSFVRGFAADPLQFFGGGGGGGCVAGNNCYPNGSVCTSGNDCISRYCNLTLSPAICQ